MSNIPLSDKAKNNRLVQAFSLVAADVTEAVIRIALHTHTPVITADEHGNILRLNAQELARKHGLKDYPPCP